MDLRRLPQVAPVVSSDNQEPRPHRKSKARYERVGEANPVQIQVAALLQKFHHGSLGTEKLLQRGPDIDGGRGLNGPGSADPLADRRLQMA